MLDRAKRASHIDPPASSYAIMRRARPYRGENPVPGKDVRGELDPTPGIREQPRPKLDMLLHFCRCARGRILVTEGIRRQRFAISERFGVQLMVAIARMLPRCSYCASRCKRNMRRIL